MTGFRQESQGHDKDLWNPTRSHFFPIENGVLYGLGLLSTSTYWTFQDMSKELKERIEIYKKKSSSNTQLTLLVRAMDDALICIYLHLVSCGSRLLNSNAYTLKYMPSSITWKYTNHAWTDTNLHCIRAFTNKPEIAQYIHRAGLPIWFIWP